MISIHHGNRRIGHDASPPPKQRPLRNKSSLLRQRAQPPFFDRVYWSKVVASGPRRRLLNGLGKLYPDLRERLNGSVTRLFDLEKAFRNHFYHPRFGGRASIKATLPALGDLSYNQETYGIVLLHKVLVDTTQ